MASRARVSQKPKRSERKAEEDNGGAKRRRAEWAPRMLGVSDVSALDREIQRFRAAKRRMTLPDRKLADPGGALPKSGIEVIVDGDAKLTASATRTPGRRPTWGHTGRYVAITGKSVFASATLRFSLTSKDVAHLDPDSVRLARWEPNAKRFFVVPFSGFDAAGGYAYGRITSLGIYTAVGLPRDPRIRTTLEVVDSLRPWGRVSMGRRGGMQPKICGLILCASQFSGTGGDAKALGRSGYSSSEFTGGDGGGNVCKQCLGADFSVMPEVDLVDATKFHEFGDYEPVLTVPTEWENVGPVNVTGRIAALAIHPTNGAIVYAGSAGGGVWKTTDSGSTWHPTMSEELSLAIGGLGLAVASPDVLYAATGEWTGSNPVDWDPLTRGVGVYRTTNGGTSWTLCAAIGSTRCAAVAVDPQDANRVFVAGDRALHRSRDGGATWDVAAGMVHGVFDGSISDVVIDPNDLARVYIGVHADGVYRSTDGGDHWTRLTDGLPTGNDADGPKLALGRNGTHGSRFVAAKLGARVFTSTDGASFIERTPLANQEWAFAYNNVVYVDPDNEDILIAGAVNLYRSTTGGSAWTKVAGYGTAIHPDMQAIVVDRGNRQRLFVGNDGGVWASTDRGQTWTFASRGLVATQVYGIGVAQAGVLRYAATLQDSGAFEYQGAADWSALPTPEGGYLEYDPADETRLYVDTVMSKLERLTSGANPVDLGINSAAWGTPWAEPLAISRQNTSRLLAVEITGEFPLTTRLVRSTNGGTAWNTVLDPGVAFSSVRFAGSDDAHAYAASTDGRVWHSVNVGAAWTELDTAALPNAKVQTMEVDRWNPQRLFVAFAGVGHRHFWRGDLDAAGNVTWFDMSGAGAGMLPDLPITGLAQHPTRDGELYVSNMVGVLRTSSGGTYWTSFDAGLPNAFVSDLDVREADLRLYAGTYGRGVYHRDV